MSDEDEGLPLADALRVFGDPQLWAAYESARAALNSIQRRPTWLRSSRQEREAWSERYEEPERAAGAAMRRAGHALEADLQRRLHRGELVATGMKRPISEESERIVIPARLWPVLVPNFKRSSAEGEGFKVIDIRIRRGPLKSSSDRGSGDPAGQHEEPQGASADEADANATPREAETKRGRRGQPSLKKYLLAEMERRAAEEELCELQAEEFRALQAWAREEQKQGRLPKHRVPKARSIEKGLAKRYQELKAKKSMR